MSVKFTTFGSLSMLIERSDGYKILVDPFISKNPHTNYKVEDFYDVDLILVSHVAFDHLGDAPQIFANSKAIMRCDRSSYKKMHDLGLADPARLKPCSYGAKSDYGMTTVRVMKAYHNSAIKYDDGNFIWAPALGYMIMVEPGVTYYAPGDTASYGDMRLMNELYHPNVMSCGIGSIKPGGGREKDTREAALEVLWLGADVVFPGHYVEGSNDLEDWKDCMRTLNPRVQICEERDRTYIYTPYSIKAQD